MAEASSTFYSLFRSSETSKYVSSKSLTPGFDTETPQRSLFLHVIGAVAEFERELIRERIKDKLNVLKAKGKKLGRPSGAKDKKERKKGGYYLRYSKHI